MNKLNVIKNDSSSISYSENLKPKTFREQTKAKFERKWKNEPAQFNPMRSARERLRIRRTIEFLKRHVNLNGIKAVDLGSGYGHVAKVLHDEGALVDVVDIAQNALCINGLEAGITPIISCVPNTHLADSSFDLVVSTELIGHLSTKEHRLFFNELARLVKRNGRILFSTSVDIHSVDALDKLINLINTEWEILEYQLSYHSRQIRLTNLFSMPRKFFTASQKAEKRQSWLEERHSIWHSWFKWNSTKSLGYLWSWIAPVSDMIEKAVKQSDCLLSVLEKISHSEASISHIIILAKRKQLFTDTSD